MDDHSKVDELLRAAKSGSNEALGHALESCRAYLTLVAHREIDPVLRAKGGASDIVQETFMEAQRAFHQFDSETQVQFVAWLRTMLLNNVADFTRRYAGTARRAAHREVTIDSHGSSHEWRAGLAAPINTPSGEFVQHEEEEALGRAIRSLPEDYQQIVTYRYLENRSFDEIATLMGRSSNAVCKLFARAIDRLQRELESET